MERLRAKTAEAGVGKTVTSYMHQAPFTVGGQLWTETGAAIARWIASDSIHLNMVESEAFRSMCRTLNGRCPAYSWRTISRQVR